MITSNVKQRIARRFFGGGFSKPTSSIYNRVSSSPIFQLYYELVANDIMNLCPEGKLLDVGTGPGRLLIALGERTSALQLSGIDLSPSMVEKAKENIAAAGCPEDVDVRVGNANHIPFADNSFDIVVSSGSIHFWQEPIIGVNELYRVVKPGGYAVIYDIVRNTPYENIRDLAKKYGKLRVALFWLHNFADSLYSREELAELARLTAFGEGSISFKGILCRMTLFKMAHFAATETANVRRIKGSEESIAAA